MCPSVKSCNAVYILSSSADKDTCGLVFVKSIANCEAISSALYTKNTPCLMVALQPMPDTEFGG